MARAAPEPAARDAAAQFESLYRACYQDLLGYALRRSDRPEEAADLVAETFLVAWRRIDDVPVGEARLWLFGVMRNLIANHHRAVRRGVDLAARLRNELAQVETVQPVVPPRIRWVQLV